MLLIQSVDAQSAYKNSWTTDGFLVGGSIVTAFVASAVDDTLQPPTLQEINNLSRSSVNWLDRSATYNYSSHLSDISNVLVGLAIIAPIGLLIDNDIRDDWKTFTLMYIETLTFATFTPSFAKGTVQRYRPFVYNADVAYEVKKSNDPKRSFFSGHTTWAFASAVFFSTVYNDYHPDSKFKPYVLGASLLLASGIGYMRYQSGAHFVTDVVTGAIVGSVIGYGIPYLHRIDNDQITMGPSISGSSILFSFSCKF